MRRTKSGPALFEVLTRGQDTTSDTLKTPEWWSASGGEQGSQAEVAAEKRPAAAPAPSRGGEAPGGNRGNPPFLELVGSRVRLTFTSGTAAAAVFLLMTSVLAGFELGRRSGDAAGKLRGYEAGRASYAADALDEIQAARTQPLATHVVRSLLAEPESETQQAQPSGNEGSRDPEATQWIRDYTYIVAQEFAPGRTEDAQRAQTYLAEHGIATALVKLSGGAIQLITTQGYNRQDPTQKQLADKLLEKEHSVGGRYFADGGQYRLKGYFRTLKGDRW